MRAANPTLMADDWYFLDVFGRKAIDHTLTFGDFFVRRAGSDHSEPLIKLVVLWCLRSFNLDLSVEAIVGTFVALGYALIFRLLIFADRSKGAAWTKHLAWLTITAALLSLNSTELWSWAENSMQYSSDLLIPVFLWAVWRACTSGKYVLLPIVAFAMAVVGDDNALICVVATFVGLGFLALRDSGLSKRGLMIVASQVAIVMLIVRLGYHFAPRVGGSSIPLLDSLKGIYGQLEAGHWRSWLGPPLVWGVISRPVVPASYALLSSTINILLFVVMLLLQVWFWMRAFRVKWNMLAFVAVCLMLVTYGWYSGILLYRAPVFGVDAFSQPRYVRLYEFGVIALVLMWMSSASTSGGYRRAAWRQWLGAAACLVFLAVQIPLSVTAWGKVPYIQKYYQDQARQTYALSGNPKDRRVLDDCNPQLFLCLMPLAERSDMVGLVRKERLGIFSGSVVLAHPLLVPAMSGLAPADRVNLLSAMREHDPASLPERRYGRIRAIFSKKYERWPESRIDVNSLPSSAVPLVLQGCWPSDGPDNVKSSWCGSEVSLVLKEPPGESGIVVDGWLPWSLYGEAGRSAPITYTITANGAAVAVRTIARGSVMHISIDRSALPSTKQTNGLLFLTIASNASFVPSRFSKSLDSRELSVKLSSVGFLSPDDGRSSE